MSHEHSDHWKGAGPISRYAKCPIYMSELSYEEKKHQIGRCEIKFVNSGDEIRINDLVIKHFSTKHDTKNSFGYLITEDDGPSFAYVTDTGMITPLMANYMLKADVLLLEADYDDKLLDDYEEYDDWLKARIMSSTGHLSNTQSIEFLVEHGINNYKKVIFAHLSPRTNTPDTIIKMASSAFPDDNEKFLTAPLTDALDIIKNQKD